MPSKTVEKAREGKGRKERKESDTGQLRAPDLNALYTEKLKSVEAGEFEFRVVLLRPEKPSPERLMILDRAVTAINWTEESPVVSGSITLMRPSPLAVNALPIREYHRIRLLVRWGGAWFRIWELRVNSEPEPSSSGELTIDLVDPLAALRQNERDWEFKKSKHRPQGWSPEEVVRFVATKEGVEIGKLAKGKARFKKLKITGSALDVIMKVYAAEQKKSGSKFVIRIRDGKLEITPVERHKVLYEIKGMELDYSTKTGSPKKKRPITIIEAKGRIDKKKIEANVFVREVMKRLGMTAVERSYGKVDSRQELIEKAQRDLAEELIVNRTASLEIPGIPFIERGDNLHWITREPGWKGPSKGTHDRSFAYVTGVTHNVTPGSFVSSLNISQHDPFLADAESEAGEDREAKKPKREKHKKKNQEEDEEKE